MKPWKVFFLVLFFTPTLLWAKSLPSPGAHHGKYHRKGKAHSSPVKISLKNGLKFSSPDAAYTAKIGGYFQEDAVWFSGQHTGLYNSLYMRRVRVYIKGTLDKYWYYNVQYDFAGNGNLNNAYIAYNGFAHQIIKLGHFLPNINLNQYTLDKNEIFIESALPVSVYSRIYSPGAEYTLFNEYLAFHTSLYAPTSNAVVTGNDPLSSANRIIFDPINHNKGQYLLHFGASGLYHGIDRSGRLTFLGLPGVRTRNKETFLSGVITNADHYWVWNGEIAIQHGPFEMQVQYLYNTVKRRLSLPTLNFNGFYISAAYFLTGEHRVYNHVKGSFSGVSPLHHSFGAVQLAVRYDQMNLDNQNIRGGKERDITAEINWFYGRFIQFMFDYTRARANPDSTRRYQTANVYALRVQVTF